MRIKERWRQEQFIRAAKKQSSAPTMIMQLPVAMADLKQYPGADRTILAAVYPCNGNAVIVPGTRRCGILVVKWELLMAYLRRREVIKPHECYNTDNYPILIARDRDRLWDIYANEDGKLAAVAASPGRNSSHFGDKYHVRHLIRQGAFRHRELTKEGRRLIGEDWLVRNTCT